MSLHQEVAQIIAERIEGDPVWRAFASGEDVTVTVSGDIETALQTIAQSLVTITTALTAAVVHIADAVDDPRGETTAKVDEE